MITQWFTNRRKGQRRRNTTLEAGVGKYVAWAASRRYASSTLRARRRYLQHFAEWFESIGITRLRELDNAHLEAYRRAICELHTRWGAPLGTGAVTQRLLAVRGFLRWWSRNGGARELAGSDALALPRRGFSLPARVLTDKEAERLLALPDSSTILGLRDRAILEVFYAAGLRRAEVARLAGDARSRSTLDNRDLHARRYQPSVRCPRTHPSRNRICGAEPTLARSGRT